MCENKEKPSVSEDFRQKSSTSDVEKFRIELLARAAVKLGRSFLFRQIRASRTANLTEDIYLLND